MIVAFKGRQDCGKTAAMVGTTIELLHKHGYSHNDVVSNVYLKGKEFSGYTLLDNKELKKYVHDMCKEGYKHHIILIDEIDSVFPHRFWQQKGQTDALLGLWQDVKLFNWVLYTAHLGLGVDKLIRECTQICVLPQFNRSTDSIELEIIDGLDLIVYNDALLNVSKRIFPYYDRWYVNS
jgi:hypothetical protein